ncbi:MAG: hypothetical protein KC656_00730 [Myxococcales bacterium]|nr:hypothetical protein [Myxococcales bacterium]MCB9672883.1 hypothetical protein [Alphaproteobacteria bacterium]
MRFTITDELPHPLDLVFSTHRDKLEELVEYLPNVESAKTVKREEDGPVVRLENHWVGATSDVPGVVRPWIKAEMLSWIDYAEWDASTHTCRWRLELGVLPGAITAKGETKFREEDGETIADMVGEFVVHPERLPGVPTFVAKKAAPALEKFIVGLISPNLRKSNAAVVEYIDDNL